MTWDDLPLVLDPKHIKQVTGLGTNNVYELFHRKDFPAIRVGKCLRVGRDAFRNWLESQGQPAHTYEGEVKKCT